MSAKKVTTPGPQQKTLFSFFGKSQSQTTPLKKGEDFKSNVENPDLDTNESIKENVATGTPIKSSVLKKGTAATPGSVDRRVRFSISKKEEVEESKVPKNKGKRRVVISDDEDDSVMAVDKADNNAGRKRRAPNSASKKLKEKKPRRAIDDDNIGDESIESIEDDDDSFIVDDKELEISSESEEADFSDDSDDESAEEIESEEEDGRDSGRGSKAKKRPTKVTTTPVHKSRPTSVTTPKSSTKNKLASFQSPAVGLAVEEASDSTDPSNFPHLTQYDFLKPSELMDAQKRRPDHPDYDPTTLYVPPAFIAKQTPAIKQWWMMKSKYYDTVLCFKVGKFYELFHMDAVVAVNELGLIYMRGETAHAGFPEIAFPRYADQLVQRGYKVGRVEQTETPQAAQDRAKEEKSLGSKSPAADLKVVRREMCQVVSAATRTPDMMCGGLGDSSSGCLMAISEKTVPERDECHFGIVFVDTTLGTFYFSSFTDDRARSSLRTVIAANRTIQILINRKEMNEETMRVLQTSASSATKDNIPSSGIAWNAANTVKDLAKSDYFRLEEDSPEISWPDSLAELLLDPTSGVPRPKAEYELVFAALGGLVVYLRRCLIDESLLSLKQFVKYSPPDVLPDENTQRKEVLTSRLVLDSITLRNLDLMENSANGTLEGTLLELLDSCATEFGRRLLKEWISSPLTNLGDISDRQTAISELSFDLGLSDSVRKIMRKIPDLERSLNKMHTYGHPSKSSGHPDSRAVLFEDETYRKRRIEELVSAMNGFRLSVKVFKTFAESLDGSDGFQSVILRKCVLLEGNDGGMVPNIEPILDQLEKLFDLNEAKKTGKITPKKGLSASYDKACMEIVEIERRLEELRLVYKRQLKLAKCEYWGTGKNRYQLEIPEGVVVPSEFNHTSKKKGFKRYKTDDIDAELSELLQAEERKEKAMRDSMRATFAKFDAYFLKWQQTVRCLATIDCILALATYSANPEFCVPEFQTAEENDGKPYLSIQNGCHPSLLPKFGSSLIANDTMINFESNKSALILTGPNMGGKSTLMRQVGLLVILAHLGCKVPATSMKLTPVDRIFTRMGASDRILAGESTFFVELAETAVILQRATKHSLVLLDELGRGTSTYDGLSVAAAVLEFLASKIGCRTIFSTHYHLLVSTIAAESNKYSKNVSLCHMACKVDDDAASNGGIETITFLYKLVPGACPRSYGFNAARLAGLPVALIEKASTKAEEFEREERVSRRTLTCMKAENAAELMEKMQIVDNRN